MTDKGESSKHLEHEAMDYLESGENTKSSVMMQAQKMSSPVAMTRKSSTEVLPGSPGANAVSSESAAGCSKALAFTSSSRAPLVSSKSSETLRTSTIPADDEDWNTSRLYSLLRIYHNHHKNAKVNLEKIGEVILGDQDILRKMTERIKEVNNTMDNIDQSKILSYSSPNQRNKIRLRELLHVGRNLVSLVQVSQTEADIDVEDWKLLEIRVTKNLAGTVQYLKIAAMKVMVHMGNSSSSASKLSLSAAVMWLNNVEKSLIVIWHDLCSFVMHRKLDYQRIIILTERMELFLQAFKKLSNCPGRINFQ